MMMTQYDAHGRFVRRARYNAALAAIWSRQIPYGRIVTREQEQGQ
jgi:hypothetical protein